MARKSRAEAERTKQAILERAVDQGSIDGLESLSIGQLAEGLGMSKSGVIGHFGSKEQLQLATVEAGIDRFIAEVWLPASGRRPGLDRLLGLMDAWLSYLRRGVFPGGCFMTTVAIEFDDRPGPVKDRVAQARRDWLDTLQREVERAQAQGEISVREDPSRVVFQLHALVSEANWRKQLFGQDDALAISASVIGELIARLARR